MTTLSPTEPGVLVSSICDVVTLLPNEGRINVLLYAMECLPMDLKSREVIENAVKSVFQVSGKFQDRGKVIRAHLLRAKSRIMGGLHDAVHQAQQDLQAILQLDPGHNEASELLTFINDKGVTGTDNGSNCHTQRSPHLSNEIWWEIASFLPRRDLRSLVSVPHVLSSIARQLLFRDVSLQFMSSGSDAAGDVIPFDPVEMDKWHTRRSAAILWRLASDSACASQVRSLTVWAPDDSGIPGCGNMVTLATVLPKLTNLKVFRCRMDNDFLSPVMAILEKNNPDLEGLFIVSNSPTPPQLPRLSQLKCFAFKNDYPYSDTIPDIQSFLTTGAIVLCTLVIDNNLACYPDSPLSISDLRNLCLQITFPSVSCFMQLLEGSQKLESLRLEITPGGDVLSGAFRSYSGPGLFPALREFSFIQWGLEGDEEEEDPDLFPAIAEVVRGHPMLETLCLSYRNGLLDHENFGYDAALWGVLPSLLRLRTLSMDVPENLPPDLCGWLIPRTVVVLEVRVTSWEVDYAQLLLSLPSGLKFLAVPSIEELWRDLCSNVLPSLRLVFSSNSESFQTVHHTDHGRELRELGPRQQNYYLDDWLKQLNCEEVSFLYSDPSGFGGMWR